MRIAICEDVAADAQRLRSLLEQYLFHQGMIAQIDCFKHSPDILCGYYPGKYHIVFMDIYMENGNPLGMETAKKLHEADNDVAIIFTTSSDSFGIAGYRVAVYYILKPVVADELELAMSKCKLQLERFSQTIDVLVNRKSLPIRLSDIYYVEVRQKRCIFVTKTGTIESSMPFEPLVKQLEASTFWRCHRSYIINQIHVTDLVGDDFILHDVHRVPISRAYRTSAQDTFSALVKDGLRKKP